MSSPRPKVKVVGDKIVVGELQLSANAALVTARKLVQAAVQTEASTPACRAYTVDLVLTLLARDLLFFDPPMPDEPPPGSAQPPPERLLEVEDQPVLKLAASKQIGRPSRNLLNVLLGKE